MFMERDCKFCGTIFSPQTANQQYCCKECRENSDRERAWKKSKSYKSIRSVKSGCKAPTIYDIVEICEKTREQTGRIIGYGLVSHLSDSGKIDSLGVNL